MTELQLFVQIRKQTKADTNKEYAVQECEVRTCVLTLWGSMQLRVSSMSKVPP
jgi:hypothetical protein